MTELNDYCSIEDSGVVRANVADDGICSGVRLW